MGAPGQWGGPEPGWDSEGLLPPELWPLRSEASLEHLRVEAGCWVLACIPPCNLRLRWELPEPSILTLAGSAGCRWPRVDWRTGPW